MAPSWNEVEKGIKERYALWATRWATPAQTKKARERYALWTTRAREEAASATTRAAACHYGADDDTAGSPDHNRAA